MRKEEYMKAMTCKIVFCYVTVFILWTMVAVASADKFKVNLDNRQVKWGEAFRISITAANPYDKTVQGGITVSFSSNLIITHKQANTTIYYEGSKVYQKPHICCIHTKDIMVENWYRYWPSKAERTMTLTVFVIKTGTMEIYSRAAFIENIKKKTVTNLPRHSSRVDQQGYPVQVSRVDVARPAGLLEMLRSRLDGSKFTDSQEALRYLQRLIENPHDAGALRYFGIDTFKDSPQFLATLGNLIRQYNKDIPPDLARCLAALAASDRNVTPVKTFKPVTSRTEKRCKHHGTKAHREADRFLNHIQGGSTLIELISAEKDICYSSKGTGTIEMTYNHNVYQFRKNKDIVLNMARKITQIKPDSQFIHKKEPFCNYSYTELIDALTQ